ncbi:MAG: VanZ family protein [Bacteroidota bacterium]
MKLIQKIKYHGWAIAWSVFILILCCMKMPASSGTGFFFEGFDKMVHLGFFFILTVLLFFGRILEQRNYRFRFLSIFKILVITASIGAAIEAIQFEFFPYRSAEIWDFACDMLGVSMAICSYILLHKSDYYEKKN